MAGGPTGDAMASALARVSGPLVVLVLFAFFGHWAAMFSMVVGLLYLATVWRLLVIVEREHTEGSLSWASAWGMQLLTGDPVWTSGQRPAAFGGWSWSDLEGWGRQAADGSVKAWQKTQEATHASAELARSAGADLAEQARGRSARWSAQQEANDPFADFDATGTVQTDGTPAAGSDSATPSKGGPDAASFFGDGPPIVIHGDGHDDAAAKVIDDEHPLWLLRKAELVELARERSVATSGTKAELIERLLASEAGRGEA